MKKILIAILSLFVFVLNADARVSKDTFSNLIVQSGIDKSSVSVSIKDLNSGKVMYKLNENILMHPASVQKILTLPPAIEVLGEDYEFRTVIYSRGDDGYVIKLGADPYLSASDLRRLVKNINKSTVKKIFIDDSIIEKKDWGEGWQWDDDLNTSMPHFNAYNLDKNIIKVTVMPDETGKSVIVINPSKYPVVFINNVQIADKTNVKVSRDSSVAVDALALDGTVSKPATLYVPTKDLKGYFYFKLTQALADKNIYLKLPFAESKLNSDDIFIEELVHPVSRAVYDILKNSNNLVIETVMKLAAEKKYGERGTDVNGIRLFNDFCEKRGIDNSRIRLVDASGVSKNNLVDTDFITEFLVKNQDNPILNRMSKPGEGTLTERMLPLKDVLRAKTGTLSDISSIAGFVTSQKGKRYAFCIIINDPKSSNSEKKLLEDYLIRELYIKG